MKIGVIVCGNAAKWKPLKDIVCEGCLNRTGCHELVYFNAVEGQVPTLENTRHLDAIYCLGSAKSANEDAPWMLKTADFFRSIADTKLKVVGSCFGHQLVNKAFGGTVGLSQPGFVFGADRITFDRDAITQAPPGSVHKKLCDILEKRCAADGSLELNLLQSHGEEVVELPEGAKLLASSQRCRHEVVLVRDNILTLQCHPDLTPELMMQKIWPALLEKGKKKDEEREAVEKEMEGLDTKICLDIIEEFFKA